jgi:hypothetical protein
MGFLGTDLSPGECRPEKVIKIFLCGRPIRLPVIDPASFVLAVRPELPKITLPGNLFEGAVRVNHPILAI